MFDWLTTVISDGGYVGIVLLMLAENLFPPIPSELIMPLAGLVAVKGELSWLPFRPDTWHEQGGLGISPSTDLCRTSTVASR